jgi:hypothetical protein
MNFADTYSRMDNDELLRLTSQWTTLTDPAQVALAAEMEKRKLGNEFKAERQIALEKPTSPSRNRHRTTWLVVIAIAVGRSQAFSSTWSKIQQRRHRNVTTEAISR